MIESKVHRIKNPRLQPYVEYILFNKTKIAGSTATSFSNNNICLGLMNESKLMRDPQGHFVNGAFEGVSSYISGLYLKPHKFVSERPLDEICIDLKPLGFYHFFRVPLSKYILDEDFIALTLGKGATTFFEQVFQVSVNACEVR